MGLLADEASLCTRCGIERPLFQFGRNKDGSLRRPCKVCSAEVNKSWRESKIDTVRALARAKYQEIKNDESYKKKRAAWRDSNRDRIRKVNEEWRKKNKDRKQATNAAARRARQMQGEGGLLWEQQGGKCAICSDDLNSMSTRLRHLDHCHNSGKLRGWLCHYCNTAIGLLGDDPQRLRAGAHYLEAKNGTP